MRDDNAYESDRILLQLHRLHTQRSAIVDLLATITEDLANQDDALLDKIASLQRRLQELRGQR